MVKVNRFISQHSQLITITAGLLLVSGTIFYSFSSSQNSETTLSAASVNLVPTKQSPGVIQSEEFATSLEDNDNDKQVKLADSFPETTENIYMVLGLNGAKLSQKLEYTRYLNGKFIDKGRIQLPVDDAKYATIAFGLKEGKLHPKGKYVVKTYTDGAFERSAKYIVE